jgi:hypothetical protein
MDLFFASFGNAGPTTLVHIGLTGEVPGCNARAFVEVLALLEQVVGATFPAGSALASRILSLANNKEKNREALKDLHDERST